MNRGDHEEEGDQRYEDLRMMTDIIDDLKEKEEQLNSDQPVRLSKK